MALIKKAASASEVPGMIRAVACDRLRLDRERIILSEQDTASKPIKARPGQPR